jgi:hypothetical protein
MTVLTSGKILRGRDKAAQGISLLDVVVEIDSENLLSVGHVPISVGLITREQVAAE